MTEGWWSTGAGWWSADVGFWFDGPASGSVTFKDGATPIGSGTIGPVGRATLLIPSGLPIGTHELTAVFENVPGWNPSTSTPPITYVVTAGDHTPPEVITETPADNATGVSILTQISVEFSEPVAQLALRLTDSLDNQLSGALVDAGNNVWTFTPTEPLDYGNTYHVRIIQAVDGSGNALPAAVTWSFTTELQPSTNLCGNPQTYDFDWIIQESSDVFTITQDETCVTRVTAASNNLGTGSLLAFWLASSPQLVNAEVLSRWEGQVGSVQQGHFHHMRSRAGRLSGIAVLHDLTVANKLNVSIFDSAGSPVHSAVGSHTFSELAGASGPKYLRTQILDNVLLLKLWDADAAEPDWSSGYVAEFDITPNNQPPYQTNDDGGDNGWLAGAMSASEQASFSALLLSSISAPPPLDTFQHSGYSIDEILDLAPGVGQVDIGFEYEVLDRSLAFIDKVHPSMAASASIRVNTGSVIKRSMSGFQLNDEDATWIDVFQHRIRPVMIIDGHRFPLGVFVFGDTATGLDSSHISLTGTMSDQGLILDQPLTGGWSTHPGDNLYEEVLAVLRLSSIPHWDLPDDPGIAASTPMVWKPNEHLYKILADLFDKLGWMPPYFNNSGTLVAKPIPSDFGVSIDHQYWTGGGMLTDPTAGAGSGRTSRIFDGSLTIQNSLGSAPNRYIAIASDATRAAVQGIYIVPASAPHSYERRGYYVTKVITDSNITSASVAQQRAREQAQIDLASYRKYEFAANPDPRHDVYDVVAIDGEIGVEYEWALTLKPEGPHTHKIRKLWSIDAGE